MHDEAIRAARKAMCEERCAQYGEPSCYAVAGGPSPACGCDADSRVAIAAFLAKAHENTDPEETARYCLLGQLRKEIA